MRNTRTLQVIQPAIAFPVVTRAECSDAAWALLAEMNTRIINLQDQLREARAVICKQKGHLPTPGIAGTWCERCNARLS
ncbi:MAG: hypothetical protein Q7W55_10370 [Pseudohongiella sp.]|nr:hypothetical protein [Pseudohongiella sp.]